MDSKDRLATLEDLGVAYSDVMEDLTNKADVIVSSASGSVASVSDASAGKIKKAVFNIEPVQDLHGYDYPWPAGGGKNLYDPVKYRVTGSRNTVSLDGGTYTITWINGAIIFDTKNVQMYDAGEYTISAVGTNLTNVNFYAYSSTDATLRSSSLSASRTFTASEPFYLGFNGSYSNKGTASFKIQLEKGSTASAWTPYSNICPISGHTEVDAHRTGVNVWGTEIQKGKVYAYAELPAGKKDKLYMVIEDKDTSVDVSDCCIGFISSDYDLIGDNPGPLVNDNFRWIVMNGNIRGNHSNTGGGTISADGSKLLDRLLFYPKTDNAISRIFQRFNISVNYPSTDNDYHAYNGQQVTYQLGDTVYSGKLTVNEDGSGSIFSDMTMVDMGTLTWAYNSTYAYFYAGVPNKKVYGNVLCSQYKTTTMPYDGNQDNYTIKSGNNERVFITDKTYSAASVFTPAMSGVQLCYELAEPVTIPLTAQEVLTLVKGENNVWCDTGDTEIEYRADTKLYIDNKFAELQALILEN